MFLKVFKNIYSIATLHCSYPFYLSCHLLQMFIDIQTCCDADSEKCDQRGCEEKTPEDCKIEDVKDSCPVKCEACPKGTSIFLKNLFD